MNGVVTGTAYELPTTAFSYLNGYWDVQHLGRADHAGGSSGSCPGSGDAYSATLGGATLIDGQTIQGQFVNANTTTCPTLSLNGNSAIPILSINGNSPRVGSIGALQFDTLIYDSPLNAWLTSAANLGPTVPITIQVALANTINAHLWYSCWPHTNDNCTSQLQEIRRRG